MIKNESESPSHQKDLPKTPDQPQMLDMSWHPSNYILDDITRTLSEIDRQAIPYHFDLIDLQPKGKKVLGGFNSFQIKRTSPQSETPPNAESCIDWAVHLYQYLVNEGNGGIITNGKVLRDKIPDGDFRTLFTVNLGNPHLAARINTQRVANSAFGRMITSMDDHRHDAVVSVYPISIQGIMKEVISNLPRNHTDDPNLTSSNLKELEDKLQRIASNSNEILLMHYEFFTTFQDRGAHLPTKLLLFLPPEKGFQIERDIAEDPWRLDILANYIFQKANTEVERLTDSLENGRSPFPGQNPYSFGTKPTPGLGFSIDGIPLSMSPQFYALFSGYREEQE